MGKISFISAILILAILVSGCTSSPQSGDATGQGKLKVVATFYPFYDITKNIGGDRIELSSIVPPASGVEPHDYEPSPNDIIALNSADVFVTTGVEFAQFEDNLVEGLDKKIIVIKSGEGILQIAANDAQKEEDPNFLYDPHIWVSAKNAIIIATNIKNGLQNADPKNADYYEQNASVYIGKLKQLDADFATGLADCNKHIVLTSHSAFGYLGRDYGFEQIGLLGLSVDTEPTSEQVIQIIEAAKKENIKYIFYEELVDPEVAETIAKEVGAKTLLLSPIEGVKSNSSGESYISLMKINLQNLKVALECQD